MLGSWCRIINSTNDLKAMSIPIHRTPENDSAHRLDRWTTTFTNGNTASHLNEIGSPDLILVRLVGV